MNEFLRLEREAKIYKEQYPKGTRIELISMNDSQAVPPGTRGTVNHVDDLGTIHMNWDNGRTLSICPQEDSFRKLTEQEIEQENMEKRSAIVREATKLIAGPNGNSYDGYSTSNKWNGWECPLFNKENASKICEENSNEYCQMSYDEENDCFIADYVQDNYSEKFNGYDYLINGKIEHLYPIGSHSWTWEKGEQKETEDEDNSICVEESTEELIEESEPTMNM